MLPSDEIQTLHIDAAVAINLAVAGEVADGMRVLVLGLRRAQDLHEEWSGELTARYQRALSRYCGQWGLPAESIPSAAEV